MFDILCLYIYLVNNFLIQYQINFIFLILTEL